MSGLPPEDRVPGSAAVLGATVLYGMCVVGAVLWFWLRDEQDRLAQLAAGDDALTSLAVGTVVGLGASALAWGAGRYLSPFAKLEARLQEYVGDLNESEIIAIAMASAIGEEMLFRGALQDHLAEHGYWYLSALAFGALHVGPGLLLWTVFATVLGFVFAVMVQFGFGLLSVTVAHALINYISLRRMAIA